MNFKPSEPITARRSQERNRRQFLGGSDARIIMSPDESALIRLWKEKRGEAEPEDLSDNLIVQLGVATEPLNRTWYERNAGRAVTDVQRWVRHPVHRYLAATLDGFVNDLDAVFEAKFMLPWSFSEEAAAEKHMAQLQHNMWVTNARSAALSIITGGGKWIEMTIPADALYQHFLVTAERRFWRCVQTGQTPRPYGVEPPRPRVEAVRVVDMNRDLHSYGDEASWWAGVGIDPLPIAHELWRRSRLTYSFDTTGSEPLSDAIPPPAAKVERAPLDNEDLGRGGATEPSARGGARSFFSVT